MIPFWLAVVLLVGIWIAAGLLIARRLLHEVAEREREEFAAACRRFEKPSEGDE